jgi:hypothetical protein
MNKKILILSIAFTFAVTTFQAQNVGINATGSPPNASAGLDIDFPNKGLLIPRVALTSATDVATIPSPATSLLVYNNGSGGLTPAGYYYWDGSKWVRLLVTGTPSDAWLTTGNSGTSPSSNFIGTIDNTSLVFRTNNTEQMRLHNTGQLSIGDNTPGGKLDVHQTSSNDVARFTTYGNVNSILLRRTQGTKTSPSPTSGAGTVLGRFDAQGYDGSGFTTAARIEMSTDATGGSSTDMPGRITFWTTPDNSGTPIERMRITNNGNVGIGTNAPSAHLEVRDNLAGALSLNVTKDFTGVSNTSAAFIGGIDVSYTNTGIYVMQKDNVGFGSTGSYIFNVVKNGVSQMLVNGVGNVGIGTTSPNVKLEIVSGNNTEFLRLNRGAGNPFQIFFGDNLAGVSNPQGVVYFEIGGNETYVMGGHTVPDGHLNRDLGATGHYWNNAYVNDVYFNSCGAWLSSWTCSDNRYKKEITPIESNTVFKNLLKLQGVYYYWKKDEFPDMHFNDKRQIGLIAQEVEKVFPELVNTNENGYKSIEYAKFAPLFIESIKELYTKNKELEKKVEMLEKELTNIKSHIGITAEK